MKDIDILFESLMPLADNNLIDINDINENTTAYNYSSKRTSNYVY